LRLSIAPLSSDDLVAADRVFRMAFGTRNNLPDPMRFDGDASRISARLGATNVIHVGASEDNKLIAFAMATIWGSYAWFGPLAVLPEHWNDGIGQRLIQHTMQDLDRLGIAHTALFTVAESTKHVALYRKFGFWPCYLTMIMKRDLPAGSACPPCTTYRDSPPTDRMRDIDDIRELTGRILPGLDLSSEIDGVAARALGDVVIARNGSHVSAFAICHFGAGSEAESGSVYIKFAGVRPGEGAAAEFERLMGQCEDLAASHGLHRIVAGVNTARRDAYLKMAQRGFRAIQQGIAMHRPEGPGYDRPDVYAIDDLR
jgi:GNAT superfamily N-acetyltransferase